MRARVFVALLAVFALVAASPVAAADRDIPPGAQPLPGGGYAVPLKADTPEWYTPELHRKVVAAGEKGRSVPIPRAAEVPQSALLFTGIRPGSWMISPAWCTMNFVFGDASLAGTPTRSAFEASNFEALDFEAPTQDTGPEDEEEKDSGKGNGKGPRNGKPPPKKGGGGGLYIGSAGHCGSVGEDVVIVGAPGVLMNIGSIVKSVDNGVGDDFSLTQIDPVWYQYVNPSMAYFGGPTGAQSPAFGDPVVHAGHGVGIGTGGTPRAGLVTYGSGSGYGWDGAAAPGDSGSGVRHAAGSAVGNLTHLVVGTKYLPAFIAGTTIDRMLQIAGKPLATASVVPDPLP